MLSKYHNCDAITHPPRYFGATPGSTEDEKEMYGWDQCPVMIDYSTMVYSLPHVPSGVNGVKVSKHGIGQVVSSADHIVTPATLAWLEARRGKGWQVLSTTPA